MHSTLRDYSTLFTVTSRKLNLPAVNSEWTFFDVCTCIYAFGWPAQKAGGPPNTPNVSCIFHAQANLLFTLPLWRHFCRFFAYSIYLFSLLGWRNFISRSATFVEGQVGVKVAKCCRLTRIFYLFCMLYYEIMTFTREFCLLIFGCCGTIFCVNYSSKIF